jgi:hypothetical protein
MRRLRRLSSANRNRRHLNDVERAKVAATLANMPKHLHKADSAIALSPISQADAAKMMKVRPRN